MRTVKNTTVGDSAVDLLLQQYKGKAGIEALVRSLVAPADGTVLQELEVAFDEIVSKNVLATAIGDQLKLWARVVGCKDSYTSDELFRTAIYLQIAINVSQGDPERLIDISQRISHASFVHYIQKQPAVALLYNHMLTAWSQLSRVQKAATGGVRVVETGCPSGDPFVLGAEYDAAGVAHGAELSYGHGFSEESPAVSALMLAVSYASQKLYSKTVGGSWAEFSPQPDWGTTFGAIFVAGLPGGGIITLKSSNIGDPISYSHWSPATGLWTYHAAPAVASGSRAYWDAQSDIFVMVAYLNRVDLWDGTVWSQIGTVVPTNCTRGFIAFAADDVWAAHDNHLYHWDGANWTDLYATVQTAIGVTIGTLTNICRVGSEIYACSYDGGSGNGRSFKRSGAGVWSDIGNVAAVPQQIWGSDSTHLWILASSTGGALFEFWMSTGGAWVKEHTAAEAYSTPGDGRRIFGLNDGSEVWVLSNTAGEGYRRSAGTWTKQTAQWGSVLARGLGAIPARSRTTTGGGDFTEVYSQ